MSAFEEDASAKVEALQQVDLLYWNQACELCLVQVQRSPQGSWYSGAGGRGSK